MKYSLIEQSTETKYTTSHFINTLSVYIRVQGALWYIARDVHINYNLVNYLLNIEGRL